MPNMQTQIQAIQSLGTLSIITAVMLGLVIAMLGFSPNARSRKIMLIGSFAAWIAIIFVLIWLVFDPAIRAMKFVNSPAMFALIGVITGVLLFALRKVRRDVYGALELAVAIASLLALGRKYDTQNEITIIIGSVGAIYVVVRGLTNVAEHWSIMSENVRSTK